MTARGPFETLEGEVTWLGEKSLKFRETATGHEFFVPLSQVRDGEYVKAGDVQIDASKWILNRLEEEGKR